MERIVRNCSRNGETIEIEQNIYEEIKKVLDYLKKLNIEYRIEYHPPLATIDEVLNYWGEMDSVHCKNLFFRNHKGRRHYLVLIECRKELNIAALEKMLKQGKLTFASPKRMERYLGVTGGSVSPFGLLNDEERHVKLFIDKELKSADKISFHPNDNRASVTIRYSDFIKFLEERGNEYEYI